MADKCPKCGETLVVRSIQKKMGLGSIDLPVAQVCPKCNWSRDLTGAGDIVVKPPATEETGVTKDVKPAAKPVASQAPKKQAPVQEKPKQAPEKPRVVIEKPGHRPAEAEKRVIDANKMITIVLGIIVIAGLIWAFLPKGGEPVKDSGTAVPTPAATTAAGPGVTTKATAAATITPTGNNTTVKIDRDRGYLVQAQKDLNIKPGDGVIWKNDGTYRLTLSSTEGLFPDVNLDGEDITSYVFLKTGKYSFDIVVNGIKKFSGTVTVEP